MNELTCEEIYTLSKSGSSLLYRGKKIAAAFVVGWPVRLVVQQIATKQLRRYP